LLGGVRLPGDWALYAISVCRLTALHSGFLHTPPHDNAHAGRTQSHSPDGKKRGGADEASLGEPLVMQVVVRNEKQTD